MNSLNSRFGEHFIKNIAECSLDSYDVLTDHLSVLL